MLPETLRWTGGIDGNLELLDQRLLPQQTVYLTCRTVRELFDAIRDLAVRGAPAIGVAAGYGAVIAARAGDNVSDCLADLRKGVDYLAKSRPTAVNLAWALDRMLRQACKISPQSECRNQFLEQLLHQAKSIDQEDRAMCRQIGDYGGHYIKDGAGVLTHCNAGSLATSYYGTALAVIYHAWQQGRRFRVYVDETRPVLQGARLTYWELTQSGVDAILICDNMAGYAMQLGKVDVVVVGADRIAANGDVANKVGTYSLAVLALKHNIPFYVAAPASTFDLTIETGADIPIEQRNGEEVRRFNGVCSTVENANVWNPAFDVTPSDLVTAIITDRGVIEHPTRKRVTKFLGSTQSD